MIRIFHDRPGCISCGACAAIAPAFWGMDEVDTKSFVINGKKLAEGTEELLIEEKDLPDNLEAAECCPVNVIHVFKDNKKLI